MTDAVEQLFDPDQYKSPEDKERKERKVKFLDTDPDPEPWVDPWVVVSTRKGPLPYTHLPIQPEKLAALRQMGTLDRTSLKTVCGEVGWPISRQAAGIGQMLPCPSCKAGQ